MKYGGLLVEGRSNPDIESNPCSSTASFRAESYSDIHSSESRENLTVIQRKFGLV